MLLEISKKSEFQRVNEKVEHSKFRTSKKEEPERAKESDE